MGYDERVYQTTKAIRKGFGISNETNTPNTTPTQPVEIYHDTSDQQAKIQADIARHQADYDSRHPEEALARAQNERIQSTIQDNMKNPVQEGNNPYVPKNETPLQKASRILGRQRAEAMQNPLPSDIDSPGIQ